MKLLRTLIITALPLLPAGMQPAAAMEVCEELLDGRIVACADGYFCARFREDWGCKSKDGTRETYKPKKMGAKKPAPEDRPGKFESRAWENKKLIFKPLIPPQPETEDAGEGASYDRTPKKWPPGSRQAKANARNDRGSAYYKNGDYTSAIGEYSAAIDLNPEDPALHNNRGNAFYMLTEYKEAINDFDAALSLQPDLKDARRTRDSALKKLDQKRTAELLKSRPEILRPKTLNEKPALTAPQTAQGYISIPNAFVYQNTAAAEPQQNPGWARPPQNISALAKPYAAPEAVRPPEVKSSLALWTLYCAIGFFLTAAAFPAIIYLVLRSEQGALRKELQPLADKIKVNIRCMFFGFFIPPESGFHPRLLISLAIYLVTVSLAACFVFFTFSIDTTIKLLAGLLITGGISCAAVFSSHSLKAGDGQKDAPGSETQTGRTRSGARPGKLSAAVIGSAPPKPPAPYAASSSSEEIADLMKAGRYKEALEEFSKKRLVKFTDTDRADLFEIYIRLGDYARAGNLFESLKRSKLLAEHMRHYNGSVRFLPRAQGTGTCARYLPRAVRDHESGNEPGR